MPELSRRRFTQALSLTAMGMALPQMARAAAALHLNVGVISDEISEDFEHACSVIKSWGLHLVELRQVWGKNLQQASAAEIAQAQRIIAKYGFTVTDIASPLFKVDWPDAPPSQYGSKQDLHGAAVTTFKQQDEVLERSIELAKQFKTNQVRCFDFWRIDNVAPYRAAINAKLNETAEKCGRQGIQLALENEFECNTATGREAAATLAGVPSRHLGLNWDPGNAVMRGELDAFPAGWNLLPKDRIIHCHVKNATKDSSGKIVWAPVNVGYIDWAAQFRALAEMHFAGSCNLETHYKNGQGPESSSQVSWKGMVEELNKAHIQYTNQTA